jgi:very-short-patch-repair endonuclease
MKYPLLESQYNWSDIQYDYDNGYLHSEIKTKYKIHNDIIREAKRRDLLKMRPCNISQKLRVEIGVKSTRRGVSHTQEAKDKISKARKLYIKLNPDTFFWRNADKFKSVPCEKIKEWLITKGVKFVEEYPVPETGRFFKLDIAIVDKKIAIEVNGSQHYNTDGSLKSYYQQRHELIEKSGWKIFEIHYSMAFKLKQLEFLITDINNT